MEIEGQKKRYTWRPKYPHTYDTAFEEFLESEEFERLEADVMSMVYKAFQKGYLFGLGVSAPRVLELTAEAKRVMREVDEAFENEDAMIRMVDEFIEEGSVTGREGFELLMGPGGGDK